MTCISLFYRTLVYSKTVTDKLIVVQARNDEMIFKIQDKRVHIKAVTLTLQRTCGWHRGTEQTSQYITDTLSRAL